MCPQVVGYYYFKVYLEHMENSEGLNVAYCEFHILQLFLLLKSIFE